MYRQRRRVACLLDLGSSGKHRQSEGEVESLMEEGWSNRASDHSTLKEDEEAGQWAVEEEKGVGGRRGDGSHWRWRDDGGRRQSYDGDDVAGERRWMRVM